MFTVNIIVYLLSFIILVLVIWLIRLEMKIRGIFGGKRVKDFEEVMHYIHDTIKALEHSHKNTHAHVNNLEKRMRTGIRAIETVRFNPFQGRGEGGNQSFSSAFLDENGNGVVLSSLYSRDRVSIFSKPINEFSSEYELTPEERRVIEKAKGKVANEK